MHEVSNMRLVDSTWARHGVEQHGARDSADERLASAWRATRRRACSAALHRLAMSGLSRPTRGIEVSRCTRREQVSMESRVACLQVRGPSDRYMSVT